MPLRNCFLFNAFCFWMAGVGFFLFVCAKCGFVRSSISLVVSMTNMRRMKGGGRFMAIYFFFSLKKNFFFSVFLMFWNFFSGRWCIWIYGGKRTCDIISLVTKIKMGQMKKKKKKNLKKKKMKNKTGKFSSVFIERALQCPLIFIASKSEWWLEKKPRKETERWGGVWKKWGGGEKKKIRIWRKKVNALYPYCIHEKKRHLVRVAMNRTAGEMNHVMYRVKNFLSFQVERRTRKSCPEEEEEKKKNDNSSTHTEKKKRALLRLYITLLVHK